ncbi:Ras family protein (macronuclear) [Tetrahymena thermophila SB210]|uniref:Ras family protein n=1 Tax=Tetrahymena thermophila (strain SB210) TaxID=312017 RepID=I7M393_TETTS|nr:Ras family protein [Tetrahymena thermophila SB210]EAS02709.2 Ras family protein [Tetrahymena thermophila SB210]|eukprot:XP_001022954.2 Ras family protein [Tetrahymena thermophila SB210]
MSNVKISSINENQNIQMKLAGLKDLLKTQVENRNQEQISKISSIIKQLSVLPNYFSSQNVLGYQIGNYQDKIDYFIASQLEYLVFDSNIDIQNKIRDDKGICLLLSGKITLEKIIQNENIQNKSIDKSIVVLKEFKKGSFFSFYDIQYQVEGSKITISGQNDLMNVLGESEQKQKFDNIEVGYLNLQLQKEIKSQLQTANYKSSIFNYYDSIIKKEISLMKLNYGFTQYLSEIQIGQILFHSQIRNFSNKEPVFLNKEESNYVYIVRKGSFQVFWRDYSINQQRQSIFFSNLDQENSLLRRWSLRVYESKEIFGEDDIIFNCRQRCFDVICNSVSGQLITIQKNYFLYCLYPMLKNYFNVLVEDKEKLINERINQIRNQQGKNFTIVSPSLQSTQPISRECKEISLEDSYNSVQFIQKQQSLSSPSVSPDNFCTNVSQKEKKDALILQQGLSSQLTQQNSKQESQKSNLEHKNSNKMLFQFILNKSNYAQNQPQQMNKKINNSIQARLNTKRYDNIGNVNRLEQNIIENKQIEVSQSNNLNQKVQKLLQQNLTNSLSFTQKEEFEQSFQNSLNKLIEYQVSQTFSSRSIKNNSHTFNNPKSETAIGIKKRQKNLISEPSFSFQQISPSLKDSNSLIAKQKKLKTNNFQYSQSPNKNSLQNFSEINFPQTSERRTIKKNNSQNAVLKRQANRVSPIQSDKAIVLKSSSESASQGTNNSEGVCILQALQASNSANLTNTNNSHSTQNNKSINQKLILNSNNSSSISVQSAKISNGIYLNQSSGVIQEENQQTFQKFHSFKQEMLEKLKENHNLKSKKEILSKSLSQKQQQQQQTQSLSCYSNMIYSKIKEKDSIRKNLKKEYSVLNKKGNINALSQYSFKLGNYKIKSELLSNSFENLKQISTSNQEKINKLRRKFSGEENMNSNKPKYLFTPSSVSHSKFSKKSKGQQLLEKIVGGSQLNNKLEYQNLFLNSPLQQDVKSLLEKQQSQMFGIDKILTEQSQKPSITQRATQYITNELKFFNNDTQNSSQAHIQTDTSPQTQDRLKQINETPQTASKTPINTNLDKESDKTAKSNQNNSQKFNNIHSNQQSSSYHLLQQITKYQHFNQNIKQINNKNFGKLKQLISQSFATPKCKNISSQKIQQTCIGETPKNLSIQNDQSITQQQQN